MLDLSNSEDDQVQKMHVIIEKTIAEETLITSTIQEVDEARTYGEKLSDQVAKFGGSWKFIISIYVILIIWIFYNI